jgi:group I intron endonuclease
MNYSDYLNIKIDPKLTNYSRQDFSCIYRITSKVKNKSYIGSAKHFGIRRRNHVFQLENKKHHNIILQRHINKYGINDIYFEVLEIIEWNCESHKREQFYIDKFDPYFNICRVANSCFGRKPSKESCEKMSKSQLGKRQSIETRTKRSVSLKDSFLFLSDEKKENRKIAGKLKSKKVICNETGVIYNSISECEKKTGCDNVSGICLGIRNNSFGFTFKFYTHGL